MQTLTLVAIAVSFVALYCVVVLITIARKLSQRLAKSIELINGLHQMLEKQNTKIQGLYSQLESQQQQIDTHLNTANDPQAIIDAALHSHSQQISTIEQQIDELRATVEDAQSQDPVAKMYNKANQLAADGASVEDIMQACELPRSEVEVIMGFLRKS